MRSTARPTGCDFPSLIDVCGPASAVDRGSSPKAPAPEVLAPGWLGQDELGCAQNLTVSHGAYIPPFRAPHQHTHPVSPKPPTPLHLHTHLHTHLRLAPWLRPAA